MSAVNRLSALLAIPELAHRPVHDGGWARLDRSLLALASDSVGQPLIIRLIIQTILLDPSGAIRTDGPSNVSRLDPSGADQADADHPTRNRKVEGSRPSSGST